MISFIFIVILLCLCLSLFSIYLFIQFRKKKTRSLGELQRIKYSISPSFDLFTKKFSHIYPDESSFIPIRSQSLANNIFVNKCTNRRQSAIVDSKQIAQIEFMVPPSAEQFRRRSIGICNNITETKPTPTIGSIIRRTPLTEEISANLIPFSITFCQGSQILIEFQSLPEKYQQLTIKIKLYPEGKTKKILFNDQTSNEYSVQFNHIPSMKLSEKSLLMKFYGKDLTTKKSIYLGQIGKIHFNQLPNLHNENPLQFLHQLELIKLSSIEILLVLEQINEHTLTIDIQRVKGLKIDQKHLTATGFFQIVLLDRHRALSTHQSKSFRLNSSTFSLNDPIQLNILAFNGQNLDRMMILIQFYSNGNSSNEYQCLARMKFSSYLYSSGTGTIHWQQFQERQSFSMWHTLIKP